MITNYGQFTIRPRSPIFLKGVDLGGEVVHNSRQE